MPIRWILALEAVIVCVLLGISLKGSIEDAPTETMCEYYENGAIRECSEHNIISAKLIVGVSYLEEHDGAVIGVFTILLTVSTAGLWLQTWRTAKIVHNNSRASLWVQDPTIVFVRDDAGNVLDAAGTYTIHNFGPSPAIAQRVKSHLFRGRPEDWPDEPYYKDTINETTLLLKPHSNRIIVFTTKTIKFTNQEVLDFRSGAKILVFYGFVEYSDTIEPARAHRSGFALKIEIKKDGDTSVGSVECGPPRYWDSY
jgi:hypothetical protein